MSTARQRQLRRGIWRGFALALLVFTAFAFALDYVDDEPASQRQADHQAEVESQARAREDDLAHKAAVLTAIKESFMGVGLSEQQARDVINLIRKGDVPNISISY